MKKETKEMISEIAERAVKTFFQAFLSAISVDILFGATDFDAFKKIGTSMLIAAIASGISAVWNGIVQSLNQIGRAHV